MHSTADAVVLVSDLDGTLLDTATYSSKAATEALTALKAEGISLVLSSSKTRAEMEPIRKELVHEGPFIVENGGALFIPHGFFPHAPVGSISRDGYEVIEFGTPYRILRAAIKEIARVLEISIRGFGDMSAEGVSELTGLAPHEAMLAQQREYDEPFVLEDQETFPQICREAAQRGLMCTKGGQFYHLLGPRDKGHACRVLLRYWRDQMNSHTGLLTIGIGDSANDLPMLAVVDQPILVQGPDGTHDPAVRLPHMIYAPGVGPVGWNAAVLKLVHAL
jgi:mannosyl-3-phosphoglycerate phosphatase